MPIALLLASLNLSILVSTLISLTRADVGHVNEHLHLGNTTGNHIRHLPIVNDSQVMGLISIGDVVREMIAFQKSMIEQLQSYIAG